MADAEKVQIIGIGEEGLSGLTERARKLIESADLLIGEWGVLDLNVDTTTLGDSGGLVLRAFLDVNVAVRHPASFAAITDASTA